MILTAELAAALILGVHLEAVAVTIEAADDVLRVEARYRITGDAARRFRARRFARQEMTLVDAGGPLRQLPGLAYFDAAPGTSAVTVRYELRGRRDRVPLFVPDPPVAGPVEIRVRGIADDRELRGGFPRLERQAGGELAASLDQLPSFVRLPPRGRWTVERGTEAAVVLLVAGATLAWVLRRYSRS